MKTTTKKITSQERGFLNFLRLLMSAGLSLIKNVFTPLAKSGLQLQITDAAIQSFLVDSGLLRKGITETVENEKKQKEGFLSMLAATLGAIL